jgi:hypothetical protein
MKFYLLSYIASLLLVLIGERIIGGSSMLHYAFTGLGLVAGLLFIIQAKSGGKPPLFFALLHIFGLSLSILGAETGQDLFQVSDQNLQMWSVILQSLGAIAILSALFPLFALHHLFSLGQKHANLQRTKHISMLWLGTAFVITALFPSNYIASAANTRWDVGYFKTAIPGESSISLVDNLSEPITAYLFFRVGMDVTDEIRGYFDQLPQKNLNLIYIDKDKEPELSKDLGIKENGMIALVKGDGENRQIKRISVGKNLKAAKRILKKLDEVFRENLMKLTQGASVLYFTTGHGEMVFKKEKDADPERTISLLKRGLRSANFTTKELSISNGLANQIPEDASAILILAPQIEFSEAECATILDFWKQGRSLFIALEPDGATLNPLLSELGLEYHQESLAHSNIFMPTSRRSTITDRRNIVTNKFSTHPAVTTLSRYNKVMQLVFSNAGYLTELKDSEYTRKTVIKSLEDTWIDQNGNFNKDPEDETALWSLAITVENDFTEESAEEKKEAKAIVFSDGTWLNDQYLGKGFTMGKQTVQPHAVTLSDALFWLTDKKEASGTVNNEQDIKIQHSKEGQGWIFFASSLFIPLSFLGLGLFRIKRRRKGGA